jgi:hypothetical protein
VAQLVFQIVKISAGNHKQFYMLSFSNSTDVYQIHGVLDCGSSGVRHGNGFVYSVEPENPYKKTQYVGIKPSGSYSLRITAKVLSQQPKSIAFSATARITLTPRSKTSPQKSTINFGTLCCKAACTPSSAFFVRRCCDPRLLLL